MKCRIKDCSNEALPDKLRCSAHSESASSGSFVAVQSSLPPAPFSIDSVPVQTLSDQELSDLLGRLSQELALRNRKKIPGSSEAVKNIQEIFARAVGKKDPRMD